MYIYFEDDVTVILLLSGSFKNTTEGLSAIPFDFPCVIACYLNIGYAKISIVESLLHLENDFKLDCSY